MAEATTGSDLTGVTQSTGIISRISSSVSNVRRMTADPAVQKSIPLIFGVIVAFVGLIVFFTILGIALFILAVKYYKDKKNFQFLKRMNQNNIVDYANPVYETREYYSQDSDTVINRHGVMNNPVYLEPEDPEKDYYTI